MKQSDIVIVGGGIAGIALAAQLAGHARVVLLERESALSLHTTGRSAAIFSEAFGVAESRQRTRESREFFEHPPAGFATGPLLTPRPTLYVSRPESTERIAELLANSPDITRPLSAAEALHLMPVLRPGEFTAFAEEWTAADIDVGALFDGFRRQALHGGVEIFKNQEVVALSPESSGWTVVTGTERFTARIVVDAAGAWAGRIGLMAGLGDRGLSPLRRTAVLIDPPEGLDISTWHHVDDIADVFYFKPEAGLIFASPSDETLSEPCDAQPEDIDVATIAYEIERATTLTVSRIRRRWAGLRTFTSSRTPLVEFDKEADGFFWLAGLGGFGIQTAPSISTRAAAMILDRL